MEVKIKNSFFSLKLFFLLFLLLQFFIPARLYFLDTPEYLFTAIYLDISHPPGNPLFSQLANIFTLLPFAPLIFRVELFVLFASVLSLFFIGK
ncbi:MAG: DUF2723 domain-containing protein, partial [Candidatus Dadabacteria bacterium]